MDLDPKVTSDADLTGEATPKGDQLPRTEGLASDLLKGRYLLGPELGRGGFAITYVAADLEVASRKVVVKVLNEYRSNDAWALKKFRIEMEALARIDHPNVVSVLDFGYREDGKPFLVMQYVLGRQLRAILPRQGMPLAQIAHIMRQTGRALTAAHEVDVCHLDLKPENIIIQSDREGEEQVKLIDFGIASIRAPGEDSSSTHASGTYAYMSPEQFHGKGSCASDVYGMGVVAYELVTGITPFRAPTPGGILMQQMEGLKVPPRDLRPDLPEAAQQAILKALSADPRDRYERARDFGEALATALVSTELEPAPWVKPVTSSNSNAHGRKLPAARSSRWLLNLAMLLVIIGVCGAAYFILRGKAPGVDSVAVLPFHNRTGDPQMAYLAEGITESLINDLSRIPTLRVSARGSVVRYDSSSVDARAAGRELGVTRVVDGSISRQGDDFSLDTELIDVRSGVRLWGNAYTGKISSLAEVLQQFSIEVTDQLRLKLSEPLKQRLKRQYAVGSEAYQQYLKGRFYLNKRTAADFQEAIRYFNQAIAADPEYAPAYSGLADTYGYIAAFGSAYGGMIPAHALKESRVAAERALHLDGTLAEAFSARAFVEMQADYNWKAAEQDFLRAIELDPKWPNAHELYAFELGASGRLDEAVREVNEAADLDPNSLGIKLAQGQVLRMAGRNDESLEVLQKGAATPLARGMFADYIAANYWAKSMPKQALATVENIPPSFTPHLRIPLLAAAYARAGNADRARELLNSYIVDPNTAGWYYLALAHLGLHQTEHAIDDLEHAYDQRYEDVIWFGVDPMLDQLRSNPRFHRLVRHIGLGSN